MLLSALSMLFFKVNRGEKRKSEIATYKSIVRMEKREYSRLMEMVKLTCSFRVEINF
jgi:hypothetical protein